MTRAKVDATKPANLRVPPKHGADETVGIVGAFTARLVDTVSNEGTSAWRVQVCTPSDVPRADGTPCTAVVGDGITVHRDLATARRAAMRWAAQYAAGEQADTPAQLSTKRARYEEQNRAMAKAGTVWASGATATGTVTFPQYEHPRKAGRWLEPGAKVRKPRKSAQGRTPARPRTVPVIVNPFATVPDPAARVTMREPWGMATYVGSES